MARAIKRRIDAATIYSATDRAKTWVEDTSDKLQSIDEDVEMGERLAAAVCPVCWYVSRRIGCTVSTTAECALCPALLHSGNTCVDVLCNRCAKQNDLCCRCGGDIHMRRARKRRPLIQEASDGTSNS